MPRLINGRDFDDSGTAGGVGGMPVAVTKVNDDSIIAALAPIFACNSQSL